MADPKDKADKPEPKEPKTPPAPPAPKALNVDSMRKKDGSFQLIIQVTSDKGTGMETGLIITKGDEGAERKKTESDGALILEVPALAEGEEDLDVLVQVAGSDTLEKLVTLEAPEKPREKREKIQLLKGQGILANIKHVIQQNRVRKE